MLGRGRVIIKESVMGRPTKYLVPKFRQNPRL
eukprot:SAG31_NODE_32499_length_355_cov_0.789062_1_plen_31_part_10